MSKSKGKGKRDLVAYALRTGEVSKYMTEEEIGDLYDKHKGMRYMVFIKLCESIAMVKRYEKLPNRS